MNEFLSRSRIDIICKMCYDFDEQVMRGEMDEKYESKYAWWLFYRV